MKRSWISILLLIALGAFGGATAQTTSDTPLHGLKVFKLTISVDDDAKACGVGREHIEAVLLEALKGSKLQLDTNARTRLGARASVSQVNERVCAYAFALEVIPIVTVADTGIGAYAPIWSRQAITCGPTSGATRLVTAVFQRATRELIADWIKVNE